MVADGRKVIAELWLRNRLEQPRAAGKRSSPLGTAGRRPTHSPDGVSGLGSAWRDERCLRCDGGRVAPGRGADGQTQCLAASGRAQFATPSGLAICERHGVAWPKAARRAVPLRGSRGTKRCGRVQGGPWTSPERFHTERGLTVHLSERWTW